MNPKHLHILQHSLGCDQYGQGTQYRNHFVTGPGSEDFDDCRQMAAEGLLKDHGAQRMYAGDHLFTVSDKGKAVMLQESPQSPRLTRSKMRYRDFLRADRGLSFIEWLKARKATNED